MNRRKFLESGALASITALLAERPGFSAAKTPNLPLRLNANENAIGLSPLARKAVNDGIKSANRYPFLEARELSARLAALDEIPENCILLGNGSSEILRLTVQVMANQRPVALTADPTYESIGQQFRAYNLPISRFPLRSDWSHDLPRMREKAEKSDKPVLVYICNPNNPTATLTPSKELLSWIREASENCYFVVDEAYHHYVESSSYFSLLQEAPKRKNLLVVRTFSKIYAMAGLRLGYGVANPEMIERMRQLTRLNINGLAITAASASLSDEEFLQQSFSSNKESKKMLIQALDRLQIEYLESHTNFLMHRIKGDLDSYNKRMQSEGIYVGREFPPMNDFSRVSLGLPEEMAYFCEKLAMFRSKGWI